MDERWGETDLSRKEAEVILRRIDNVLDQLPAARRQAHERIIGERRVANADKILSLYESELHVIVRGKAGADVEPSRREASEIGCRRQAEGRRLLEQPSQFGNSLFVAETAEGFILDHELRRETSPGDAKWLIERLPGLKEKTAGRLHGAVGDRGFASAASRRLLESEDLFNALCPRDPRELSARLQDDEAFAAATRRRAQTEGRIGILKNLFLQGGVPRAKGFANRQMQLAWAVLSHNLWVAARLPWAAQHYETRLAA